MADISSSAVAVHVAPLSGTREFAVQVACNNIVRTSSIHKTAPIGHDTAIRASLGGLDVRYFLQMRPHEATCWHRCRESKAEACRPLRESLQASLETPLQIDMRILA
jgi:hypothetical protein